MLKYSNICLGWSFAALEYGNKCFCLTKFTNISLSVNKCASRCTGYQGTFCGGPDGAAIVYRKGV